MLLGTLRILHAAANPCLTWRSLADLGGKSPVLWLIQVGQICSPSFLHANLTIDLV